MHWFHGPRRITMAELRARPKRTAHGARPGPGEPRELAPVRVEGRAIARSFWGTAWCAHLESCGEVAGGLGQGRAHVHAGAVLDLQVGEGLITAEVQGSSRHDQTIEVEPLSPESRAELMNAAAGKIDSIVALLRGQLPATLVEALTDPARGLFPAPAQVRMHCSCPDATVPCEHLAAVLYGFGARLDTSPQLLFRLRGLDVEALAQAGAAAPAEQDITPIRQSTGDLAALLTVPTQEPARRPVRVGREHLKVLGLAPRLIDAWLREGVLVRTSERDIYERTAEADRRIAAMLAR